MTILKVSSQLLTSQVGNWSIETIHYLKACKQGCFLA